jgi:hypothetical protein
MKEGVYGQGFSMQKGPPVDDERFKNICSESNIRAEKEGTMSQKEVEEKFTK